MKSRVLIIIIVGLVFTGIGMLITARVSRPSLVEVYPQGGAEDVTVVSPIRLVFSRPMQHETVIQHLLIEPKIAGNYTWEGNTLTFSPTSTLPGGTDVRLRLEPGARAASWLAFPMAGESWSFTTGSTLLAYLWPADGAASLYTLDPVTGQIYQLTHGMDIQEYSVNSSGMIIYFSASNRQGGANLYQIDRVEAAGPEGSTYQPKELLNCGTSQCRSPAISFDDQLLAYETMLPDPQGGTAPAQIWLLNLSTLETTQVGAASHETLQPTWSSTGWLAYYDRTAGAYDLADLKAHAKQQFSNQTGLPGAWDPDGKSYLVSEIAYTSSGASHETGTSHLLRYDLQTGITADLSGVDAVEDVEGTYAPDGQMVAFARKYLDAARWTLGRQLWVMGADGSGGHPITNEGDYNHYDLAWSLDGSMLAYVRFNQAKLSEQPELWMINVDGSNPLQLVIGGYSPTWIP